MLKEKFKAPNVYESALLNQEHELFGLSKKKLLRLSDERPKLLEKNLMELENNLRCFFGKKCDKNKSGEFLNKTEKFLANAYGKFSGKANVIVERMIELVLDHYSKNKEYYKEKRQQQEKILKQFLKKSGIKGVVEDKQ